jgi:hypothetical protein
MILSVNKDYSVRFEVLTTFSMKVTVFWVVASIIRLMIALMMEAACTSETMVNPYRPVCNNQEDSHLQGLYP